MLSLEQMKAAVTLAEIEAFEIRSIANQYVFDDTSHSPWYEISTANGLLMVGPRKRVIEINFSRTNRRCRLAPAEGPFSKSCTETTVHVDNVSELVHYLQAWQECEVSTEFKLTVARSNAEVKDYLDAYSSSESNDDPVINSMRSHGAKLSKVTNPVTREVTYVLRTVNDNDYIFPQSFFKK